MGVKLDEQSVVSYCRFEGDCRAETNPGLGDAISAWIQSEPLNLIWDFSAVEKIDTTAFGAVAGTVVVQMVKGSPVIFLSPSEMIKSYLAACGLDQKVEIADSEDDAMVKLILGLPKKYDSFFFDILVKEENLPLEQIEPFIQLANNPQGGDVGMLLLSRQLLTPRQLLTTIVRQKCRLGEILLETGLVSESQLRHILSEQRTGSRTERLGDTLLRMGLASNEEIYDALSEQTRRRRRIEDPKKVVVGEPTKQESFLLGEILLERESVSRVQLNEAVTSQQRAGGAIPLGQVLCDLGFVNDSELFNALMTQFKRKRGLENESETDLEDTVKCALDELIDRLDTESHFQFSRARIALLHMGIEAQQALVKSLGRPEETIRRNASWILGDFGSRRAGAVLVDRIQDNDISVIDAAGWSLIRMSRKLIPYQQIGRWISWWTGVSTEATYEPVPTWSDDQQEAEKLVSDLALGLVVLDDMMIEYQVGLADWIGGRTNMILYGNGQVLVANLHKHEWTYFEGRISRSEIRSLLSDMLKYSILATESERSMAASKESIHEITVTIGKTNKRSVFLWYNEIYENPGFSTYETTLRKILRDITYGKVW